MGFGYTPRMRNMFNILNYLELELLHTMTRIKRWEDPVRTEPIIVLCRPWLMRLVKSCGSKGVCGIAVMMSLMKGKLHYSLPKFVKDTTR